MNDKRLLLLFLILVSSCQNPQEATPANLTANLKEVGINAVGLTFSDVSLEAHSSQNTVTIRCSVYFNDGPINVRQFGYCFSETDSLPQLSSSGAQQVTAPFPNRFGSTNALEATLTNLKRGQTYFVDPYVILENGDVLYGRFNFADRLSRFDHKAIAFQLPQRPALQPAQLVNRSKVPTPVVSDGSMPIPNYHQFITLRGRLYSFYPSGELTAYDALADQWTPQQSLGQSVFAMSPIVFAANDKLYVHATKNYWYPTGKEPMMWEYDPKRNTWTNLGQKAAENLFNSFYQLSAENNAYFVNTFPFQTLSFDTQQNQTTAIDKPVLRANRGSTPYYLASDGDFYNAIPLNVNNGQGTVSEQIVRYDLDTDHIEEESTLQKTLAQQGYTNYSFLMPVGSELFVGLGSANNLLVQPGSVRARGILYRDELVQYSLSDRRTITYYDLPGLSDNDQRFALLPLTVNNRLYVFNRTTGALTEIFLK
ncbi:Kelch repeat-containing protein [Spirosoma agri]|uniref:Uncharacterized protein n=1 Tax=Spirosoma agri TaxID=1987381 RepID=A0A6M0IIX3_9BACT|nr:hypothetical protein [Spirosoma agri]NEU68208.1 hypothetical protein [Spirosoma agri]